MAITASAEPISSKAGPNATKDQQSPDMPASDPQGSTPRPGAWLGPNQPVTSWVAFVLIGCYVAPLFMVAIAYWTNGFDEPSMTLAWFAAFLKSADSTLNQFHKILLPVISAISIIAFKGRPSRAMVALGTFVLISYLVSIFVSVLFDMKSTIDSIRLLDEPLDQALVKSFFAHMQESLMMYLMMLLGIGVVNAGGEGKR